MMGTRFQGVLNEEKMTIVVQMILLPTLLWETRCQLHHLRQRKNFLRTSKISPLRGWPNANFLWHHWLKHLSRMLPEGDESYFKQVQDPQLRKQYRGLPSLWRVIFDLFKEITDVEFHLSFFSIITIIILIIVRVFSFMEHFIQGQGPYSVFTMAERHPWHGHWVIFSPSPLLHILFDKIYTEKIACWWVFWPWRYKVKFSILLSRCRWMSRPARAIETDAMFTLPKDSLLQSAPVIAPTRISCGESSKNRFPSSFMDKNGSATSVSSRWYSMKEN